MRQVASAIFRKELREVLRDRRTLFLALFLPLLFYPVLMGVSLSVGDSKKADGKREVGVVACHPEFPSPLRQTEEIDWLVLDSTALIEGRVPDQADAAVAMLDGKVVVYSRSSAAGQRMSAILLAQLEAYRKSIVEGRLSEHGLSYEVLSPFQVEQVSLTPQRQTWGQQFGGAGAYFMIFLAFTGCMSVAVDAGAGERERGTMEAMMVSPASFFAIAVGKFAFVLLMGGLSVIATFLGMGSVVLFDDSIREAIGTIIDVESVLMLVVLMFSIVVVFASLLYSISLLAKSSREAHLRASLVMMVLAVLLIVCGADYVGQSQWVMYVPVMNVAVVISEVISGVAEWSRVGLSVLLCIGVSILFMWAVALVFKRFPERSYLSE